MSKKSQCSELDNSFLEGCLKAHLNIDPDQVSISSGKSDLDEEYYRCQPEPIPQQVLLRNCVRTDGTSIVNVPSDFIRQKIQTKHPTSFNSAAKNSGRLENGNPVGWEHTGHQARRDFRCTDDDFTNTASGYAPIGGIPNYNWETYYDTVSPRQTIFTNQRRVENLKGTKDITGNIRGYISHNVSTNSSAQSVSKPVYSEVVNSKQSISTKPTKVQNLNVLKDTTRHDRERISHNVSTNSSAQSVSKPVYSEVVNSRQSISTKPTMVQNLNVLKDTTRHDRERINHNVSTNSSAQSVSKPVYSEAVKSRQNISSKPTMVENLNVLKDVTRCDREYIGHKISNYSQSSRSTSIITPSTTSSNQNSFQDRCIKPDHNQEIITPNQRTRPKESLNISSVTAQPNNASYQANCIKPDHNSLDNSSSASYITQQPNSSSQNNCIRPDDNQENQGSVSSEISHQYLYRRLSCNSVVSSISEDEVPCCTCVIL